MSEYLEQLHVFEPCSGWFADQAIANAATLTSAEFNTHRGQGPAVASGNVATAHGIVPIAARLVIGIFLDAAALHTIVIRGGLATGALSAVETISPGAVAVDTIVRDIFWPFLDVQFNNTSVSSRTFRISMRLFPFPRGI